MLAELLAQEGIEFIGSTVADVGHGYVLAGDRRIDVNRTIALPVPAGPAIAGLPSDPSGFIAVDQHGWVSGIEDVYAAGDATTFPIKQGGLAAQQAVAAAESIAARHGTDLDPQPFRPVLRGDPRTGGQERWMRARAGDTPGEARSSLRALWWPPTKISSRYLSPPISSAGRRPTCSRRPGGRASGRARRRTDGRRAMNEQVQARRRAPMAGQARLDGSGRSGSVVVIATPSPACGGRARRSPGRRSGTRGRARTGTGAPARATHASTARR